MTSTRVFNILLSSNIYLKAFTLKLYIQLLFYNTITMAYDNDPTKLPEYNTYHTQTLLVLQLFPSMRFSLDKTNK